MSWNTRFEGLARHLDTTRKTGEAYTLGLAAEASDFVRFNHGKVRQAGSVDQAVANIRWVMGRRHASASVVLTGNATEDAARLDREVADLREMVPLLPEDPLLMLSETATSSHHGLEGSATDAAEVVTSVCEAAGGADPVDLVGIYAGGQVYEGFASSYGHRHWSAHHNVSLDWSLVSGTDKAVKSTLAGASWDKEAFTERMASARRQLLALQRPAHVVKPGAYRAFLTSAAVGEIFDLLGWDAFGARGVQNTSSVLSPLAKGAVSLDPRIRLAEHTAGGMAPGFQGAGFVRPDEVVLVDEGKWVGPLVSPRSSKEFGLETNGASASESPESLAMAGGALDLADALKRLDTGVWVSNLWYLNYSDRNAARITGMTRFATFWVEGGELVAPLSVMRFDESLYDLLGERLEALTQQVDLLPSTSTYGGRSTSSQRMPGALVSALTFTL